MEKQKKKIYAGGKVIEYWEKTSWRIRRVSLSISPAGEIGVSRPWYISSHFLERLVLSRANWIFDKLKMQKEAKKCPWRRLDRAAYLQSREKARRFIKQRLDHFSKHYDFSYRRVAIRNQRSLWGSCSNKKNLNFNYKIIFLPADLADYIVVHELCHLQELNHSPAFWKLVAKTLPNYKDLRKKLRILVKQN
jgi:predicted metal-dependent hydrolase